MVFGAKKMNFHLSFFIILRLGDSLSSFNQDNSTNFFGEKDVH